MMIKYGETATDHEFVKEVRGKLVEALPGMLAFKPVGQPSSDKQHLRDDSELLIRLLKWANGALEISPKELEDAFGWNLAPRTAFKDIKPEVMTASMYVKMAEALARVADQTTSMKKEK